MSRNLSSSKHKDHRRYNNDRDNSRKDYGSNRHSRRDTSPYKRGPKDSDRYSHRSRSPPKYRSRESNRNIRHNDRSSNKKPPQSSFLNDVQAKQEKNYEWGRKETNTNPKVEPVDKEKPNFSISGKLLQDTNMVNGVVIKYSEPDDARKPNRKWRLYPFKGEQTLPILHIHRSSAFLMGRDRKVADIPLDHPSCSKQHAALQFRLVSFKKDNGYQGKRVRPYLIDLDSANGTFINGNKIEPRKYYELFERDVIKFGLSTREYVLLHENSKGDELDDDVNPSNE